MKTRLLRRASAGALALTLIGATAAVGDDISNSLDGTVDTVAEQMPLTAGGANGTTTLYVVGRNADGKNGCNLTGSTTLGLSVSSSNPSAATVSPSSVTFTGCGESKTLTVTPLAAGVTTISVTQTSNTTEGTFNLTPATFTVNVTAASPANTPPQVSIGGATGGAEYEWGSAPTPTCSVQDAEDGNTTFAATLAVLTGPDAANGIGQQTASCSYADSGGITASASVTYSIVKAESTVTVSCPASATYSGSDIELCEATVSGADGLSGTVDVTYASNRQVGTATASASFAGDVHHKPSAGSATFEITPATATVTITCPTSVEWTGAAQTPCTAKVTGAGGLDESLDVDYTDNTAVGTATATASFAGDANHESDSDLLTFAIDKASSTITVSCPETVTYSGSAQEPCTATVAGAGGLNANLTVTYEDNVNAGTATASASYAGDANREGSFDSTTFTIDKAASTVTVTCTDGPHVYDGSAQEPCTATVTGAGGLNEGLTVTYEDNVNAGTATASASYAGDANHEASNGSTTFAIEKATSTVAVTCTDGPHVYDGSAQEPCTALVTGPGGLNQSLTLVYGNNTNAGTASASASFAGDANHEGDTDSTTFTIDKASSTVTVTCPENVTYNGSALVPCTANVTGAGNLDQALTAISYQDNVNAGTAKANAAYDGDANHEGSAGTANFTIDKALASVIVTCNPAPSTYSGSAHTPCSATVQGAGGLYEGLDVTYLNNVDAGTATASAEFQGDTNHHPGSHSTTFTIVKAPSTVTVICPTSVIFTGTPITPCTARLISVGLDQPLVVSYTNNTAVGPVTATASYAGDSNREPASDTELFDIASWTLQGFYAPVDLRGTLNTVKAGSTVPLKFEILSGTDELRHTSAIKNFTTSKFLCSSGVPEDPIEITSTGGTSLRFDTTGDQFIQNWQTPKAGAGDCYLVTMTTQDGSKISANFKLK